MRTKPHTRNIEPETRHSERPAMTASEELQRIRARCVTRIEWSQRWGTDFHGGDAIAACRATIAAIDGLNMLAQLFRDEGNTELAVIVESQLESIIASWPEGSL